ncbi:MAG: hypothetical protein JOZ80_14925 [Acidobacteriaceae bacterium]|nr:hypothetical protein [Acidobacteriaceae bacterium]
MQPNLSNLSTDTLFDMVFVILAGGQTLTSTDVEQLEQIQVELQRRGEIEARCYHA